VAYAHRLAPDLQVSVVPFLGGLRVTPEAVRGPLCLLD
jgi:hypothetical protein